MSKTPTGVQPWRNKPRPDAYRSPYAPKYKVPANFGGVDAKVATKFGLAAAFWGVTAGFVAITFFSEVPKVRKDIMQKIPVLGDLFVKEVPASDNVRIYGPNLNALHLTNHTQPF